MSADASLARRLRIDAACDRFEAEWQAGRSPDPAGFVAALPPADRVPLLLALLPLDAHYRRRAGQTPTPADYRARFPDLDADEVARAVGDPDPTAGVSAGTTPGPGGAAAPPGVPGYEIVGELGRGGMGVVYHARHARLNRDVALKMILAGDRPGPAELARFLAEAEAAAAVRHPHVVQVYDFGEAGGRTFLAPEYLPNGTLADRLKGRHRLAPGDAARLVGQVAAAAQAAHDLGIVHRDLKPANVLLAADGTPKVTDFGLAKRGGGDLTHTGAVMGTPAYMAPEQARGDAKLVRPATDVWALGVILYQCLTGERPFDARDPAVLLAAITSVEPTPPRTLAPAVPRDLERVCLRCLEKEPHRRYPTAAALADDLRRFLAGEPVSARAAGWPERAAKWVSRRPTLAGLYAAVAAAAVFLAVGGVVTWFWRDAVEARGTAEDDRGKADEARGRAEAGEAGAKAAEARAAAARDRISVAKYAQDVGAARRDYRAGKAARARLTLDGCPADMRGWEWRHVDALCSGGQVAIGPQPAPVGVVAWSPDGKRVATAGYEFVARLWDAATGAAAGELRGHTRVVTWVGWSPDGTRLLTASADGSARVWDAATGREVCKMAGNPEREGVRTAAWSPDGTRVVTVASQNGPDAAGADRVARVWDAATGAAGPVLTGHADTVWRAAWSPDGTRLLTASDDHSARVWDAATGRQLAELSGHTGAVRWAAWDRDGVRVATASRDETARVWSPAGGPAAVVLAGHTGEVRTVEWSSDGRLVTASADATARVWPAGGRPVVLRGHAAGLRAAAWSPDGTRVLTTAERHFPEPPDHSVRVWDPATGAEVITLTAHADEVTAAAWAPDGGRVLTGSMDRTARVWDIRGGAVRVCDGLPRGAYAVAWTADGGRLAAGGSGAARVWDAATAATVQSIPADPDATVGTVAWSPAGDRLLVAAQSNNAGTRVGVWGRDGPVWTTRPFQFPAFLSAHWAADGPRVAVLESGRTTVLDAASGQQLSARDWEGVAPGAPLTGVGQIRCTEDGGRVSIPVAGGSVRVWDTASGRELPPFRNAGSGGVIGAWAPDGSRYAVLDPRADVRVWGADGREFPHLRPTGSPGVLLAWSRNGGRLATGCDDRNVCVWEPETGRAVCTLKEPTGRVVWADFNPDASRVVTSGTTPQVWDARTGDLLLTLDDAPGGTIVRWSPDGRRLAVVRGGRVAVYDSAR